MQTYKMPSSIIVSISERDILKAILEFLENQNFHIAQLALERETGVINGDYSEDVLFLRQLILDGQWDNAVDFVAPLKEIANFDIRSFRYYITKYKYYELLCIKQEPGPMHDNDFAVEEIVECLKELEDLCSSSEEFRRLCALLTLKKLSDHEDLKIWNPSSARVECFYKILPFVSNLLQAGTGTLANSENAINDRLIQLITKGLLYEAAVDYCQSQALDGKNAPVPQCKFTELLLNKQKLSSKDLSLVSWLEVIGNEQFTVPFQQKALDFKLENLKKPKLEAQWAEQILATPIKPGGQFPHSLMPNAKLKCAQKMSQSMILPFLGMSSSMAVEPSMLSEKKKISSMSHSTTAALSGFSINVRALDSETAMRQSQMITSMLENVVIASSSEFEKEKNPITIGAQLQLQQLQQQQYTSLSSGIGGFSTTNSMQTSYSSIPSNAESGIGYGNANGMSTSSYCRRELDAICRRNQTIAPNSLRGGSLPPVPELSTPGSIAPPSISAALATDQTMSQDTEISDDRNLMINSRLFQEFTNKNNSTNNNNMNTISNAVISQQTPSGDVFIPSLPPYQTNTLVGRIPDVSNPNQQVPFRHYSTQQYQKQQQHQFDPYNNRPVSMIANATQPITLNDSLSLVNPTPMRPHSFAEIIGSSFPSSVDQQQNSVENPFVSDSYLSRNNAMIMQHNLNSNQRPNHLGIHQQKQFIPNYSMNSCIEMTSKAPNESASTESMNSHYNIKNQKTLPIESGAPNRCALNNDNLSVQFVPLCRYEDSQAIRAVAFHPSGKFFAVGTNSKQMHICKYPDIRLINSSHVNGPPKCPEILLSRPKQHRGSVYCCGFNQSGELLATGSNDKTLRLMAFNADECKIGAEMDLTMHDGTVRELIFMEDTSTYSSIVVSGGAGNCHICLTDCTNGRLFKSFIGHTGPILGLYSWGPGTSFASCSQDKTIRFWDLRASSAVNVITPNVKTSNSPVTSVCVDPSGKLLVSGHEDASVMLYDIVGGRVVQLFRPHGDEVRTVRCSNAAYYLLSGSYDKRVVITDIRGDLTAPLMYLPVAEHTDKVIQCRWHPQDFTFLSTSADRTAVLWSLPTSN